MGLRGEDKGVSVIDMRRNKAQRLGFNKCVVHKIDRDRVQSADNSISLIGVDSIERAIEVFF